MAFYRHYRRGRRSYYRPLKTRNIFSYRSARAQAGQIYALRKKVNRLAYKSKPEIKLSYVAPAAHTFTNEAMSSPYYYIPFSAIDVGDQDNQRIGNKVHSLGSTYFFTFEYSQNMTTLESRAATVRLVAVQWKEPKTYNEVPSADGIVQDYSSTGANYNLIGINSLKKDCTEYIHVLADRHFTIDLSVPEKQVKLKIRPHDLRWDSDNKVNNFGICVFVSGLHWTSSSDMEAVDMTYTAKYAFTDA